MNDDRTRREACDQPEFAIHIGARLVSERLRLFAGLKKVILVGVAHCFSLICIDTQVKGAFGLVNTKSLSYDQHMSIENRTRMLQFRATPQEWQAWREALQADGRTLADVCRTALDRVAKRHRPTSSLGAVEAGGDGGTALPPAEDI